jgi:membrane associated rhomboid family serine protease
VGLLWLIHLLRALGLLDWPAYQFGIFPRRTFGMIGILTAPLTHGDWKHLVSNSIPLLAMVITFGAFFRTIAWQAFIMIYLLTGIAVWVFARDVFHIGASGVVYGLISFVFWSGVFRRSLRSIVLSLITVLIYTPMFEGVLPNQEGISWESHLLGGFVGIFVAWWFREDLEPGEQDPPQEERSDESPFLPPDIFQMTREERDRWSGR